MTNSKYEFTGKTLELKGKTLRQIKAIKSFGSVAKGETGGYIESEANLDVSGDAWVSSNARVSGDALVYGNAWVYGNALVYGDARVCGDLKIKLGSYFGFIWNGTNHKIKKIKTNDGYLIGKV